MTSTSIVHIGVDVSKKHLDLSPFDNGPARISNDRTGFHNLVQRLAVLDAVPFLTCEATGGYERALLHALVEADVLAARVNPGQVRHFIRSQAVGAKNDRIDARMLARFAEIRHNEGKLFAVVGGEEERWTLRELLSRRTQLKGMILQEKNRLDPAPGKAVTADIKVHIKHLEGRLKKLESAIDEWVRSHEALDSLRVRLCQVKGFGRISALTLIAFMPELGKVSAKRAAALAGVAPYERQSGDSQKKARIYGGRSEVRGTLYMASMAAARSNPILHDFYNRLVSSGKPKKLALIAVVRKLITLANRVAADPDFVPATE